MMSSFATARMGLCALAVAVGAAALPAASQAGADKLYVLNCGEGTAGDISRWTGMDEGKSMPFVDNCYLIHHDRGWLLWDTGVTDAVAAMPNGLAPPDPKATHWRRPKTLVSQLAEIGVKPDDIKFVAVSHTHPDHVGNVELFPKAMLLVQKAEYDWPGPNGAPRFKPEHPVDKIDGDHDVFGDGSVKIISTPGHTPGHQSLLVKLPKTGALMLTGDAVHIRTNWDRQHAPSINADKQRTVASMLKMDEILKSERAQLWINHDAAQRATLKMSPAFYD